MKKKRRHLGNRSTVGLYHFNDSRSLQCMLNFNSTINHSIKINFEYKWSTF